MKKNKIYLLVISIAIAFLVHFYAVKSNDIIPSQWRFLPADSIAPAEITEPLQTNYFGNISIDLPKHMKISYIQFNIYQPSSFLNGEISFSEIMADHDSDQSESLATGVPWPGRESLAVLAWDYKKISEQDVSQILNRPAGFTAYYGIYNETAGKRRPALGFDVIVKEKFVNFYFTYTEILTAAVPNDQLSDFFLDRENNFLRMVSTLLSAYNWTGQNERPSTNQLAMKFGYMIISGELLKIEFNCNAAFSLKTEKENTYFDMSLGSKYRKNEMSEDQAERPEGLNYILSDESANHIFIRRSRRLSFDSERYGQVYIGINISASASKDDKGFQSYILGVSNNALKSIRLI